MRFMSFRHGAFCFGHAAHAFWTWGVLNSSWGVLVLVMGRFAASPGGAESPLPAIRRRTGNEDVAPRWFCKGHLLKMALRNISVRLLQPSCSSFETKCA